MRASQFTIEIDTSAIAPFVKKTTRMLKTLRESFGDDCEIHLNINHRLVKKGSGFRLEVAIDDMTVKR